MISVESLSKVTWGGLRIGWLRGDGSLVAPVTALRGATDIGSSVPSQVLAGALVDRLDGIIVRRRAELAERARRLQAGLRVTLPDWSFHTPDGGLSLWIDLGPAVAAARFAEVALAHGVGVAPGTAACVARSGDHHIRVCFDRPATELDRAVDRLAAAWADLTHRAVPPPPRTFG